MRMQHTALARELEAPPSIDTWQAILTLILFFISNLAVIFSQYIPFPQPKIIVPLVSVLVLLAAQVFDGGTLRNGIVGTNGIEPLNIMALFISLAYISISLDRTGVFGFLASWVAIKGGNSGRKLYTYLYIFFMLCGVVVGNASCLIQKQSCWRNNPTFKDPVVLSGTPFLAHLSEEVRITPPTAWIFAQFTAANMASVVLVSSNPTNLVVSGAFGLSFLSYAAHVVLPFLAAAVLVYPVLLCLFIFHTSCPSDHISHRVRGAGTGISPIPRRLPGNPKSAEEVHRALRDKPGAIFGSALLIVTLGVLVGVSTIHVPVWMVTVPPAAVMLLRDVYHDWTHPPATANVLDEKGGSCQVPYELGDRTTTTGRSTGDLTLTQASGPSSAHPSDRVNPRARMLNKAQRGFASVTRRFPTVAHILGSLPVDLPFAFLMFILVQGLSTLGWVELFARWWAGWVRRTGAIGAIVGMGFLTCILSNFCGTNIGATILLARVLQLWADSDSDSDSDSEAVSARARDGAIFALAIASNFGAFTLTFSASLAGLLWRQILQRKGVHVGNVQFLTLNVPISFVAMFVASVVLVGQVYVVHPV